MITVTLVYIVINNLVYNYPFEIQELKKFPVGSSIFFVGKIFSLFSCNYHFSMGYLFYLSGDKKH